MTSHKRYIQYRKDELYHYNHNHDRRNGRFTSGPGGPASTAGTPDSKTDSKTETDKPSEKQSDEKKSKRSRCRKTSC